ncbi:metal ABC transporter solute-binding protein, Zn/Mn family [Synechococcus sp. CBW1107]|uniref:metal ABC transporter solute-binding protein, Zn/Mn family n=1 Tax=Synechococcus sp. CBW1107 TaxID=2789857 RepID=UPI002AD3A7E3|nr:zinc ABC transporter substrate-binding protein [Synechococcus sp. CBW1107]CAK6687183.1 Periplasmic zinc-binding protein TroA [Synechococcus sp. CBW1107]
MGSAALVGLVLAAAPPPSVVSVDGVLCDITRSLVQSDARVTCLVPPGADPHGIALRGSDRQALSSARLVLVNGYNLTPAMNRIRVNAPVVAVAERATPANPAKDPHVWHDPALTSAMVRESATALRPLLGAAKAGALQRRSQAMQAVLNQLGSWSAAQLQTVPSAQRVLVTEHRAFSAFARRYGIRELPVIDDFASGGTLRPSSLGAISRAIRQSGTRAIFAEALPPSKTLRRISSVSGVSIAKQPLYADGLAPGTSLIQTATANVCTFVIAQGGSCDQRAASVLQQQWAAIR